MNKRFKDILTKVAAVYITAVLLVFVSLSIYNLSFNVAVWSKDSRLTISVIPLLAAFYTAIYNLKKDADN